MPKKAIDGGSKKAEKKLANKIIEDKTFGLKNKNKSKAVQKYIKGVETVAKQRVGLDTDKSKEFTDKAEKKKAREEEAFLNSLFKQVTLVKQPELEEGQIAKSVLCQMFKAGKCELGDECPYSHDLNIEFNQGTFDIYTDLKEVKKTMTIEFEVNKIAEEKEKKRKKLPQSNIVCKFFLDAVHKKVYGWKWECPNKDDCHYKHFLPKGYILYSQKDKMQEEMTMEEYVDLEEQIDIERERIAVNGIKVNETTFGEWKRKRDEFRRANKEEEEKNKMKSKFTGLQLFKNQSNNFKDDEDASDVKIDEMTNQEETTNQMSNVQINDENPKTDEEIMNELDDEMKNIKINEDLFKEEDNLDELDKIIDEEDQKEDTYNNNEDDKNKKDNGDIKNEDEKE